MNFKRGEGVYKVRYGGNTGYKLWLKKKGNRKLKISQRIHGYILRDFTIAMVNLMLFNNFEFRMPKKLGYLCIRKFKRTPKLNPDGTFNKKSLPIDYGTSKKMWQEMYPDLTMEEIFAIPNKKYAYFLNEHSNGYVMKITWEKTFSKVKNNRIYSFRPVRDIQTYIGQILKNNPQLDFYERKFRYMDKKIKNKDNE